MRDMEPRKFAFLAYYHVLSILLLLVGTVHAAQPSHSVTRFKWFPLTLSFFDDTPVSRDSYLVLVLGSGLVVPAAWSAGNGEGMAR